MDYQFEKPNRPVRKVFLHCTASNKDLTVGQLRAMHKKRGWTDIGYHIVVRRNGAIMLGRPLSKVPAAQKGHNTGSIAIVLNGLDEFTVEQIRSLIDLCTQIDDAYGRGTVTFHGHNEVANKACPVFNHREVLRLDSAGVMLRA